LVRALNVAAKAARKEQMTRRKLKRLALPALAVMIAAAVAVPALAQTAPRATTLKAVGKVSFKANRYVKDGMRFNRDAVTIRKGGTLRLVDETKAPHTFSLVKRSQLPRNMRQMEACFGKGPCDDLAVAHGAVNPQTGEEQDPTTPLVNVGAAGFNRPGDSVLIPPGGRTKVKITGSSDKYYLCAIHPWMLGKVDVAG
jgi:plastocyanin